jgi:hypothetical protein
MAYVGFDKLKAKLARKGIRSPGGLAASIGRKKYGKRKFQKAAAKGQSLKGAAPAKGKLTMRDFPRFRGKRGKRK